MHGKKTESQVTLASRSGAGEKAMQMEIQQVPWWNKRTRMERRMLGLSACLLVLSVCLTVGLVLVTKDTGYNQDPDGDFSTTAALTSEFANENTIQAGPGDYCLSKGCIHTSAELLDKMDQTVNPCDDFYQFACGNFIEETVIPDDRTRTSMFSILGDKLNEQIKGLLSSEIAATEPKPFQLAKSVYQSCMDREKIEERGLEPLKDLLQKMGGWPLLEGDKWNEDGFKWYQMMYKFRDFGYSVDYLTDFSVTTDLKNSSWRILDLDQPGLGMAREYLMKGLDDPDVKAYLTYMIDVALLVGADKVEAEKQMRDNLKFEIQLANISLPREERRDASKLYNPMPVSKLTELDPTTPWLEYINRVLSPDIVKVDDTETIIVDVPSYIRDLSALLSVTPARIQANYLMWRAAAASMAYLTEEADKIALKFSKKLTGKSEEAPRWRKCVGAASGSMANAVGSLYVTKYFDEDSKSTALDMVARIRNQFELIINQVDWMDDETKERAKVKAKGMVEHIGYPPELLEMKKLKDLYEGLELSSDNYFENALNMTKFGTNYAFSKLREKVNKTDWVRHGRPAVVNAFYSPLEN